MSKQEKIRECQCAECLLLRWLSKSLAKKIDKEIMELLND